MKQEKYLVMYKADDGWRSYTIEEMDKETAKRVLKAFRERYISEDGRTGKAYPNGKGFYPFSKPRLIRLY